MFDTGIWIYSLHWEDLEFAIEQVTMVLPREHLILKVEVHVCCF